MPILSPATEDKLMREVLASDRQRVVVAYDDEMAAGAIALVVIKDGEPRIGKLMTVTPLERSQLPALTEGFMSSLFGQIERVHDAPVTIN